MCSATPGPSRVLFPLLEHSSTPSVALLTQRSVACALICPLYLESWAQCQARPILNASLMKVNDQGPDAAALPLALKRVTDSNAQRKRSCRCSLLFFHLLVMLYGVASPALWECLKQAY